MVAPSHCDEVLSEGGLTGEAGRNADDECGADQYIDGKDPIGAEQQTGSHEPDSLC